MLATKFTITASIWRLRLAALLATPTHNSPHRWPFLFRPYQLHAIMAISFGIHFFDSTVQNPHCIIFDIGWLSERASDLSKQNFRTQLVFHCWFEKSKMRAIKFNCWGLFFSRKIYWLYCSWTASKANIRKTDVKHYFLLFGKFGFLMNDAKTFDINICVRS